MSDTDCVGICVMDWDAGVCIGCGRSCDEIAGAGEETDPPGEADAPSRAVSPEGSTSGGNR